MKLSEYVDAFMGQNVPVTDYQLESFARNILETFLYVTLGLDPQAEIAPYE